jgi:hypothetical protein
MESASLPRCGTSCHQTVAAAQSLRDIADRTDFETTSTPAGMATALTARRTKRAFSENTWWAADRLERANSAPGSAASRSFCRAFVTVATRIASLPDSHILPPLPDRSLKYAGDMRKASRDRRACQNANSNTAPPHAAGPQRRQSNILKTVTELIPATAKSAVISPRIQLFDDAVSQDYVFG